MGKATIIDEIGAGQYNASLIYAGRARVTAWISELAAKIAALEAAIAEMEAGLEKTIAELRVQSFVKKKQYYESKMPADRTVVIWCADYILELTGDVGTIEVPGERHDGVNIQPGYDGAAVYDAARDGQLLPAVATSAMAAYFNRAILPGWQKWKPTFRYGTIVADSIDFDNNTCDVCLAPAFSSQQNLAVNQGQDFSDCEQTTTWQAFVDFCVSNPTHPTCTNTEEAAPIYISDDQLAAIRAINQSVNNEHEYQDDQSGYRIGDYMAIMGPGEKGDCEDFAITKMQALIDAGYPVKNLQMATVGVEGTGVDHAVLIIQTTNRGTLVLDNRYDNVKEKETLPYSFHDYQRAGQEWSDFATKLEAIPIEYMNCNALAFADGDEVVVEFIGQDFTTPKVVGFRSEPNDCLNVDYYTFMGDSRVFEEAPVSNNSKYNAIAGNWEDLMMLPITWPLDGYWQRSFTGYTSNVNSYWVFGGLKRDHRSFGQPAFDYPYPYQVGHDNDDHNNRYDKELNAWTDRATLPFSARNNMSGFYLLNKNHYAGGTEWEENGLVTCPVFVSHTAFDDITDSYELKSQEKRTWNAYWTINGKGYVHGGNIVSMGNNGDAYDFDNITGSCKEYDPGTDGWESKMGTVKRLYPSFFSLEGRGYTQGGMKAVDGNVGDLDEFDPVGNIWAAKQAYVDYQVHARPAVGAGGFAYCWQIEAGPPQTDHWKWTKDTDMWSIVGAAQPASLGFEGGRAVL